MLKHRLIFIVLLLVNNLSLYSQIGVSSITLGASDVPNSTSITNRFGAGVRNNSNSLSSRFDSTGTNFTINFNNGGSMGAVQDINNIIGLTIPGLVSTFAISTIPIPKVRRVSNTNVNNNGQHFAFWNRLVTPPLGGNATTGTISVYGPEILSMEASLVSNNINTGYDNVFQNSSASVHYNNVERIDYTVPQTTFFPSTDMSKIGFVVFDRGTGDPFKIVGVTSLNNAGDPLSFKPNVFSVAASNFGPNLLTTNFNYTIFQKDPNFNNAEIRPSVTGSQNIRAVFVSLNDLGYANTDTFFGVSLMATDLKANPTNAELLDFTNNSVYPQNSSNNAMLDMINIFIFVSESLVSLNIGTTLNGYTNNENANLNWNKITGNEIKDIVIEKSLNGIDFYTLAVLPKDLNHYVDNLLGTKTTYYRLKIINFDGSFYYSNIKIVAPSKLGNKLFPTIAKDFVYLKTNDTYQNKQLQIAVYSTDGKMLQNQTETGSNFMSVYVGNLKRGTYFLKLSCNGKIINSYKFLKQ